MQRSAAFEQQRVFRLFHQHRVEIVKSIQSHRQCISMALICAGIPIETAANHVNYDVTRLANPRASRPASVDRHASVDRN